MLSLARRTKLTALGLALVCALALAGIATAASGTSTAKDTLVVLSDEVAPALDQDGASAANPALEEMLLNIQTPLIEFPRTKRGDILVPNYAVGQMDFEPRLATSYTKKGLVWTFNLRKGVKSCAGNEFTADDVVYSFARGKSVSGAAPIGWFLANVASIFSLEPLTSKDPKAKELTEVVKVDDYTVQITQRNANELFPRVAEIFGLAPFDSKVMKANATAKDPWSHNFTATKDAPGYGPYCLTKWIKGSEVRLTANPGYYMPKPQFTNIIIRKVPSSSNRVASIKSGSADIATNLTPLEYADVAKSPKAKALSWSNNSGIALGVNFAFDPWKLPTGKLIRQAVAYAVPYADIIKNDYLGEAKPWTGMCPSNYFGYKPITTYKYDLAKAKALLAKAGFPGGKGLEKYADGFAVYYTAERRSLLEPIVNRIATSLAQIGITLTQKPISLAEFADRTLTKYDTPMFVRDQDRPLGSDVGYCSLLFYVSKAKGGLNSQSQFNNAAFDAMYAKTTTTAGPARLALLRKMQDLMMDELPVIPIAEVNSRLAVKKGITGWSGETYDILNYRYFTSTD